MAFKITAMPSELELILAKMCLLLEALNRGSKTKQSQHYRLRFVVVLWSLVNIFIPLGRGRRRCRSRNTERVQDGHGVAGRTDQGKRHLSNQRRAIDHARTAVKFQGG